MNPVLTVKAIMSETDILPTGRGSKKQAQNEIDHDFHLRTVRGSQARATPLVRIDEF
jgi:hypothetical protein